MKIIHTFLNGACLLEYQKFEDERGYFLESYNRHTMHKLGLTADFVQDNHSHSWHNVLRGLHFSTEPQHKLVRVVHGEIFDVLVDIRRNSDTFGHWYSTYLSEKESWALYVPPGIAHGFLVKSDVADVVYKSSTLYNPTNERTLMWNDPRVAINWGKILPPILSPKDAVGLKLDDLRKD